LNIAKELLITGGGLDAERGYALGLVNRVTAPGAALSVAMELAGDICESSPVSVQATLDVLAGQWAAADSKGWEFTAAAVERVVASQDRREGLDAFFERRRPRWSGR
jgi:enoyl-CoA hydratase